MATQGSGNTNPSPFGKARAFQFTLNQIEKWPLLKGLLDTLQSCDYIIACREKAPKTGHEHIHAYVHFSSAYKLSKKILSVGAHVEVCRGSPQQNIAYIMKDGDIICEEGNKPAQGRPSTCGELKTLDRDSVPPNMLHTWQTLQLTKIKKEDWHKNIEVLYISGPSGSGKSRAAHDYADDEFEEIKFVNGFYNGVVDGTGCAIYDDFRCSHMPASEFINFIDYNVHNMNIKGGNVKNNYSKIIITSITPLDKLYENMPQEARAQWMRRVTWINLTEDSNITL